MVGYTLRWSRSGNRALGRCSCARWETMVGRWMVLSVTRSRASRTRGKYRPLDWSAFDAEAALAACFHKRRVVVFFSLGPGIAGLLERAIDFLLQPGRRIRLDGAQCLLLALGQCDRDEPARTLVHSPPLLSQPS